MYFKINVFKIYNITPLKAAVTFQVTSLNNVNNQQFQTIRSRSIFPAMEFWWDFPVPDTRIHKETASKMYAPF